MFNFNLLRMWEQLDLSFDLGLLFNIMIFDRSHIKTNLANILYLNN